MLEYLKEFQIYDFFDEENIMITIFIGILIIIIFLYFYDNSIYTISDTFDDDILKCKDRYDMKQIYEFPNLLSDQECDTIIELSRNRVRRSTVIGDSKKNDISEVRTSTNAFLNNSLHPLMNEIDKRIYNIIGINPDKYEDLQVVNYKPGQFYKAHWDACDPKYDGRCVEDYKKGGLRFATFIIYLNDNMEGGDTSFPLINKNIKPKKGKGVLFFNLEDNLTERRELSKHAGLPPTSGEKWMCNKWIRLNTYPR